MQIADPVSICFRSVVIRSNFDPFSIHSRRSASGFLRRAKNLTWLLGELSDFSGSCQKKLTWACADLPSLCRPFFSPCWCLVDLFCRFLPTAVDCKTRIQHRSACEPQQTTRNWVRQADWRNRMTLGTLRTSDNPWSLDPHSDFLSVMDHPIGEQWTWRQWNCLFLWIDKLPEREIGQLSPLKAHSLKITEAGEFQRPAKILTGA